jgi:hypothetical protein
VTTAQRFDEAFRPSDSQVDRLARLMGSVRGVNVLFGGAEFEEDGEIASAGPYMCEFCGTFETPDCIHKQAARLAVRLATVDDLADLHETERAALAVGIQ